MGISGESWARGVTLLAGSEGALVAGNFAMSAVFKGTALAWSYSAGAVFGFAGSGGSNVNASCARCFTASGASSIKASDCNTCHTILAQGSGEELNFLSPGGMKFKHPGDAVDGACNDCHTGGR